MSGRAEFDVALSEPDTSIMLYSSWEVRWATTQ